MPKQSPIPNELTQPFWDAANEDRLVIQRCNACTDRRGLNILQFPPEPVCSFCGSGEDLVWHQVSGKGTVLTNAVLHDAAQKSLQEDQPLNMAVINLLIFAQLIGGEDIGQHEVAVVSKKFIFLGRQHGTSCWGNPSDR